MNSIKLSSKTSNAVANVLAVGGAALAFYCYLKTTEKAKDSLVTKNIQRTVGCVSHLRIQTTCLEKSISFYKAFGLKVISASSNDAETVDSDSMMNVRKIAILKCPDERRHQPLIILEETTDINEELQMNCASDVGLARFCFGVFDVHAEVTRLAEHGFHPITPPVTDKPGSPNKNGVNKEKEVVIVAYHDPSGNVVELVSLKKDISGIIIASVLRLQFPYFVHVNVNASNYDRSFAAYNELGFTVTAKDYGRVVNNLYKALDIADPGIAKQVALIKTPKEEMFCIDLIEWEDLQSSPNVTKSNVKSAPSSSIRFALSVDDLPNYIDKVVEKGWTLRSVPRIESFPSPLGPAIVATVQDPDGLDVEMVSYEDVTKRLNYLGRHEAQTKLILITGCDSGFGRSLACRVAALGFTVLAACYTESGAWFLDSIATTVISDLSTEEGVQKVVTKCKDILGGNKLTLWSIVNNAAVCSPGNVEWQNPSSYKHAMNVNFHAPVSIVYELISYLKETKGRVINISSVCGMVSQPTNAVYCSSKHALEAYSDCLRGEMLPWGVNVCIVQPATMRTPLALSYWESWHGSYIKAPPHRQASFSKEELENYVSERTEALAEAAEDPSVTVSAIMRALVEPNPPPRLSTGGLASFFKFLSSLPDHARDKMLWSINEMDSVHVKVQ